MSDYKDFLKKSIFLPKTEFPMKANLPQKEKRIAENWKNINLYKLNNEIKEKKFVLHIGPPYANGEFHIGHGLNLILKDTICRLKKDSQVLSIMGYDCHGLPIELAVLKKTKEKNIDLKTFRKKCQEFAGNCINIQEKTLQRLGIYCSYTKNYKTMNNVEKIYDQFSKLLLKGYVFAEKKPVPWSIKEESTIADSEIVYKTKKSTSIYIALEIKTSNKKNPKYLLVWTTTPWTLLDNEAVAFSTKLTYHSFFLEKDDREFIISSAFLTKFSELIGKKIIKKEMISITEFDNAKYFHPFLETECPIIIGDHVEEVGTGFVHIAPAHGTEDYLLWKKYSNRSFRESISDDGHFRDPEYIGLKDLHIFKDENKIIELLGTKILKKEEIEHSYPYCERSLEETPIIYRSTLQVFLNLDDWKKHLTEFTSKVNWIPKELKEIATSVFLERKEWCLSRQRTLGVPLCLFIHKKNQTLLVNIVLIKKIKEQLEKDPSFFLEKNCISILEGVVENYQDYDPILGVLDVWFDSGVTYSFEKEFSDIDIICEGKDQVRGWFQSMLILYFLTQNEHPFLDNKIPTKSIFTHGFVLDSNGLKMSKSLGNIISLEDVLEKYGSEILRILIYTSDYHEDIRIGEDILKTKEDIYRKIRNVFKFLIGATTDLQEIEKNYSQHEFLDRVILIKLRKVFDFVQKEKENFNFKNCFASIFHFIQQDLSNFYFSAIKDILYCDSVNSNRRISCRNTLYTILKTLTVLISPFLPFTAEEIYLYCQNSSNQIGNNFQSVHLENWDLKIPFYENDDICYDNNIELIKKIRIEIENSIQSKKVQFMGQIFLFIPKGSLVKMTTKELELILGVAYIEEKGKEIIVDLSGEEKCERCWLCRGNLCMRCQILLRNLEGMNEF